MDFVKTVILFIWKVGSKQGGDLMDWEMSFQEYRINKEPVVAKLHTWGGREAGYGVFYNSSRVVKSIQTSSSLLGQLTAYCADQEK